MRAKQDSVKLLITSLILLPLTLFAQVSEQPTVIIEATPLKSFSLNSGVWDSKSFQYDSLNSENTTLADRLSAIPGVHAREQGSALISIRGSSQANRVLGIYNDIPLNFADGFGVPSLLLPDEVVGEMRVFKGPASVFFGSAAMGGAVHYRTRVFERPAIRIEAADSSMAVGERQVFGVIPFSVGETPDKKMMVTVFNQFDPGYFKFDSPSKNISGRRFHNDSYTQRYTVWGKQKYGSLTLQEDAILAQKIFTAPGPVDAISPSENNTWVALGAVNAQTAVSDRAEINVRLSSAFTETMSDPDTASEARSNSSRSSASLNHRIELSNQTELQTLIDFNHQDFKASYLSNDRYIDDEAEFGQILIYSPNSKFTLQPGYRWLAKHSAFVTSLMARQENGGIKKWASVSQGMRPASLSDKYAQTSYYRGNATLNPEQSIQYEIGYSLDSDPKGYEETQVLAEASAFYTKFEELFSNQSISPGLNTKINSGLAQSYGCDFSVGYRYHVTTIGFAYAKTYGETLNLHQPLTLTPEDQVIVTVAQQLGPIVIEAKETLWRKFFDRDYISNSIVQLKDWNTFDLNLRTSGFMNWEIKTGVLNVFNTPKELSIGYPDPQRKFYASVLRYF